MMEKSTGEGYYYIKDRRYSVTALSDDTGQVVETYEYSVFGHMMILDSGRTVIAESGVSNTYGYTGRRWDNETGLWYYRNRMYSPTLGRFMQRDPAGYVDGVNLYVYVMNNPLVYLDPEGLVATAVLNTTLDVLDTTCDYWGDKSDYLIENISETAIEIINTHPFIDSSHLTYELTAEVNRSGARDIETALLACVVVPPAFIVAELVVGGAIAAYTYPPLMIATGSQTGQRLLNVSADFISSAFPGETPKGNLPGFIGWGSGECWKYFNDPDGYDLLKP